MEREECTQNSRIDSKSERVSQEQCLVQKKAEWGLLITTLGCYKIKLRLWQWRWAVTWYLSSLVYPNCTQFRWSDLYHAGGQYWSERASGPSLPLYILSSVNSLHLFHLVIFLTILQARVYEIVPEKQSNVSLYVTNENLSALQESDNAFSEGFTLIVL